MFRRILQALSGFLTLINGVVGIALFGFCGFLLTTAPGLIQSNADIAFIMFIGVFGGMAVILFALGGSLAIAGCVISVLVCRRLGRTKRLTWKGYIGLGYALVVSVMVIPTVLLYMAVPKQVPLNSPRVQGLLRAANSFDREAYGFTPIPDTANVRLESSSLLFRTEYDAMLHIESRTSRTIAFRKTDQGFRWIGEQETFQGPKQFTSVDGTFYEQISLTYDVERVSGWPTNKLNVSYSGEDPRLVHRYDLTLEDVLPVLKEWGF